MNALKSDSERTPRSRLPTLSKKWRKVKVETRATTTEKRRNAGTRSVIEFPISVQNTKKGTMHKNGWRKEAAKSLAWLIVDVEENTTKRNIMATERPIRQNLIHHSCEPSETVKPAPKKMKRSQIAQQERERAIVRLKV
jgi:hypothetical protein